MFGAGPLAVWVCELIRRGPSERGRLWFWGSVLATGELYGGKSCSKWGRLAGMELRTADWA